MADPLSITSDLEYDEGIGVQNDDSDVTNLSSALQDAIDALVSLNFLPSPPSGFPQYAEVSDFFTSGSPITDIKLASNTNGDGFAQTGTGVATDLYYGSYQIALYGTDDPNVVVGRVGGESGSVVLVIALNDDLSGDPSLGVAVYAPLVHGDGSAVDDLDTLNLAGKVYLYDTYSTVSVVPFNDFSHVPSGQDAFALIGPSDPAKAGTDLLVTGFAGSTEGTVNVSTQGLGANAQTVDNGASLRIDIVNANAADFAKADTSPEVHDAANISFQHHIDAIAGGFDLTQNNPTNKLASLTITAWQVTGDHTGTSFVSNVFSDADKVLIDSTMVTVTDSSGHAISGVGITQSADGKSVLLTGVPVNAHVAFTADSAFDRFIITNTTTGTSDKTTFDVGNISFSTITGGTEHESVDLGAHMIFEDQGPTVDLSSDTANASVDESTLTTPSAAADFSKLFTVDYGPDGKGTLSFDLGVNAGDNSTLVDTATKHGIFLYMDGDDVVGLVGTSASVKDPSGAEAFRIHVDGDGNVTLTQSRAIVHSVTTDDNDSTGISSSSASLITLTATATDNEGANSDSASATANIGNLFTFYDDGPSISSPIDAAHDYVVAANHSGATGSNNFILTAGADGLASYVFTGTPDSSGDYTWTWNSDHTVITESYKGSPLFTLTLDASDGSYDMAMLGSLPPKTDHLDTTDIKAGGPGTHYIDVGLMGSGNAIRIDGSPGFINESHAYVGVNNGNFDTGETMTFSMVNSSGTALDFYGMDIGGKSAQGSSYHWVAYDNGSQVAEGDTGVIGKGQKATIDPAGDVVVDQIVIIKTGGNANKVGLADIDIFLPPVDTGFVYNVQVTDGDGDHHGSTLTAYIDADPTGVDTSTAFIPGLSA